MSNEKLREIIIAEATRIHPPLAHMVPEQLSKEFWRRYGWRQDINDKVHYATVAMDSLAHEGYIDHHTARQYIVRALLEEAMESCPLAGVARTQETARRRAEIMARIPEVE